MQWIRVLVPALVAGFAAVASLPAAAQAEPAAPARQKVDVRAMAPGLQASDAASEPRGVPTGLTRDQRKEAALQARQEGALQPAGEAADQRVDKPAPLVGAKTLPSDTALVAPAPGVPSQVSAEASAPTMVAVAAPAAAKKSPRKKARTPAASAPV